MPKLSKLKTNGMLGIYSNIFMTHTAIIWKIIREWGNLPRVKVYLNLKKSNFRGQKFPRIQQYVVNET